MRKRTPNDIKEFKAKLFVFFTGLPNSKEKTELEKVIRGVNEKHDQDLKHFLMMIHNKVIQEKKKQTSTRDKSLLIWANIMKVIVEYLSGVNVEGSHFHHGHMNTYEAQTNATVQTQATSFAMMDNVEEEVQEELA